MAYSTRDELALERGEDARASNATTTLSGSQKAAILMVTLGAELSASIFRHLKDDEVEQLTFEIARLEAIEAFERDQVLSEFHELMLAHDFLQAGGIDYARELLERSFGQERANTLINRLTTMLQVPPFDFIRKTDPGQLVNFIQTEHPQTVALILAHLDPKKASAVLASLSHEAQADIARRIATMDRTSPDVLREVERVLEKKLSTLSTENFTTSGGVDSIVEILNLIDRGTERSILQSLEEDDPELAENIKKRMFLFEDIVLLDDRGIQMVLREVDQAELALALKAVDPEVKDKVYRNMSRRAATLLEEDVEFLGTVRLRDVEDAQQKIVAMVRKLEERGEVVIARAGEDEMVM